MIAMDIHDYRRDLEGAERRLERSSISHSNKDALYRFRDYCFALEISDIRIAKYLDQLRKMAEWLGKDFREASKDDLIALLGKLNRNGYSEKTKCDYKHALKRFYRWLEGGDEDYPRKVSWIKATVKKKNKKLPEDILTAEEKETLIEACPNIRDKALVACFLDLGCRPGELLSLRIKNINFDEYGTFLIVKGKTGMRRVRAIYSGPYLAQWLEVHPFKDSPEAPLWVRIRAKSMEEYFRYRSLERRLGIILRRANLKKRVHPYLFRHTRITEAASFMTESEMDEYFGWVQGSNMPGIYVHLSGRNVDDKLLRHYKLKKEEAKEKGPTRCPRCREINAEAAKFCYKCGLPLDMSVAQEVEKAGSDVTRALMELTLMLAENSGNQEAVKLAGRLARSIGG